MKAFISFLITAVIMGLVCFGMLYLVLKMNYSEALTVSIAVAASGFMVDYVREYTGSGRKHRVKNKEV
jgi:hypothetical protein